MACSFPCLIPIALGLMFRNVGSEMFWTRYDIRDERIHHFRLIGPGGGDIPMNRNLLKPLPDNIPLLQPLWGNSTIGMIGDRGLPIHELYNLSKPGRYRFYRSYIPPPPEDRSNGKWGVTTDLRYWDGQNYVNYFNFLLQ